jgi:predicted HNH restriction endonuclease
MPGTPFTRGEIILCTYAARFDAEDFGGVEAIHTLGLRSEDSIKLKIQNIAAMLDEEVVSRDNDVPGLTGLPQGQIGRRTNWDWVSELVLLSRADLLAECRRVLDSEQSLPGDLLDSQGFPEGSVRRVVVNASERNPAARRRCIEHYGARCFICGFAFGEMYGEVAEGFIHVHHLRSFAEIGEEYHVDPVEDLRPVCPNCHAVLHLRTPPYCIDDVIGFLQRR